MTSKTSVSSEVFQKLATFDTPTVCNAVELFEVRPRDAGYMDASIRAAFDDFPPIVGYAVTAKYRASEPPTSSAIRCFFSLAALFVKVTARIESGST